MYLHGLWEWKPLKRQTMATNNCMAVVQSPFVWAWAAA